MFSRLLVAANPIFWIIFGPLETVSNPCGAKLAFAPRIGSSPQKNCNEPVPVQKTGKKKRT